MQIHYMWLTNSLVLNYDGKTISIAAEDKRYERILELIRLGTLEEIPAVVEENENLFKDNSRLALVDGLVNIDGVPLPDELSNRILAFKEAKLPFDGLVNFWDNLKANPSFNARRMLFNFLSHNGHPLTQDGHFIAYRGVSDEFKDLHTGSFDNSPGAIVEIDRSLVDDNPNNTCSAGLHVACFDYAKGFGPKLIEVKVNPKDVVCVPTDYNGTKMRVSRFEVVREGEKPLTQPLYEADTQNTTDEEAEELYTCDECGTEVEDEYTSLCDECVG